MPVVVEVAVTMDPAVLEEPVEEEQEVLVMLKPTLLLVLLIQAVELEEGNRTLQSQEVEALE